MKRGDVMWDYCDIDGHGKKWRIAVCRVEWEGEAMIHYPLDDFSDYADERHDLRAVKIEPPKEPPAPRFCDDCGGDVPKHWTVCAPCRERRMLRKAERVEWDGDCMVAEGETFAPEPSELEGAAYCHPCEFEPFTLDLEDLIQSAADQHHDDIHDAIQCEELAAVEKAIDAFNKARVSGSWYPDTTRVIVLDEEAFAEILAAEKSNAPAPEGERGVEKTGLSGDHS